MNPELYQQGTSFVHPQQQQQTTPQPISRLANPTPYHLAQTQLRNQRQTNSDGAPPTPNNSFQANNPLSNNSFSSDTIDPQILSMRQLQYNMNHIKQESTPTEINVDLDFDHQNTLVSPMTSSPHGTPPHTFETERSFKPIPHLGSPPGHGFDSEPFGTSYKPTSHLDSLQSFGGSPGNNSLYSPRSIENVDYPYIEEFPMSAPTTTSAIGPMDVKANINNNNSKIFRHPHNNVNNVNNLSQISMSLPVLPTNGDQWCLDNNFTGAHPSSLQFPANEMISSGFMESDDTDSQKQAMLFEKRRRRRESHNAVERRRRDNINEKIQELSTLLPDLYVDSANKPNKGVILRKSVDYIRLLQSMVEQERNRNVKLETQVRELSSQSGIPIDNNSGSASSRSDLNNSSSGGLFGSSSLGSLP